MICKQRIHNKDLLMDSTCHVLLLGKWDQNTSFLKCQELQFQGSKNRVSGKRIFDEADAWTQGSTCEMGKQGGGRERSKPKSRSAAERDALPLHREESGSGSDESDEGGDADAAGVAAAGDGRKGVYKNRSHSPSLVAPSSRLPPLPPSSPPAIEVSRAYPLQRISSLQ